MIKEYELLQRDDHSVFLSEIRIVTEENVFAKSADEISKVLKLIFRDFAQEHAYVIVMTTVCEVIGVVCIGIGSYNYAPIPKASLLQSVLLLNASSVILAHNHPSSFCFPSEDDVKTTADMKKCCELLGIQLLDHFVVGKHEYYSINEKRFIGGKE